MADDDVQPYADEPTGVPAPATDPTAGDATLTGIEPEPVATERRGSLLLGVLAALGVVVAGTVVWALLYRRFNKEYVGIAVLMGLLIGYVLRGLARRSTIAVRVLAVVVTAVGCAAGSVTGDVAYTTKTFHLPFFSTLWRVRDNWWSIATHRTGLQWGVFAAALVIAFLAAGPTKETTARRSTAAALESDEDVDLLAPESDDALPASEAEER